MSINKQELIDIFVDTNMYAGVFRKTLALHNSDNLSFQVILVTAKDNTHESGNYDESVNCISGSYYEVIFNEDKYIRKFDSEVRILLEYLLDKHQEENPS